MNFFPRMLLVPALGCGFASSSTGIVRRLGSCCLAIQAFIRAAMANIQAKFDIDACVIRQQES